MSLGALVVVYAVLGPLVLDVIHFRTSASGLNQIRGGDLAALVVVVPVCIALGWLAWRGHPAVPVLALAPAIFAMYMYSQLILGNEFLQLPGNVERFFRRHTSRRPTPSGSSSSTTWAWSRPPR